MWDHDSNSHNQIIYCALTFSNLLFPSIKALGKSVSRGSNESLAGLASRKPCNFNEPPQPSQHFACKLGGRQQLCCLFSNAFPTSSISHLHNTRAWWWLSGLNKHTPLGILDPMPLLWLAQESWWMLSWVTSWLLTRLQCGQGVCRLQEMPCAKIPGRAILAGIAHRVSKSVAPAAGCLQMGLMFLPIFGWHVPGFADSTGKMVSSPPSKCANS